MAELSNVEELTRLLQEAEEQRQRAEAAERERQQERQRADKAELTSKGSITNPQNKCIVFGTLYDTFPTNSCCFKSRLFLLGLGSRIAKRKITNEKALEYFLHNSVKDPVRAIMDKLKEVEEVKNAFDLGNGIVFDNHLYAISDTAEEVVSRSVPLTSPSTPHNSRYKPPYKLTARHLRLGLHLMNIHKEVVNWKTIPILVDLEVRFQYHIERLTAAAITQTYYYIIKGRLEHGLLTMGEAIVFLKIDWRKPDILFYHLVEPSAEVEAHPKHAYLCTADERRRATDKLKTWRQPPESSPGYEPKAYKDVDRSPYLRRGKGRGHARDRHTREQARRQSDKSSDDELRRNMPDTPTPMERRTRERDSQSRGDQGGQGLRRSERILVCRLQGGGGGGGGGSNDRHSPGCSDSRHLINQAGFVKLLREQLERTLDDSITPLGQGGARGVLFKMSLLAYGYTFDLEYEAEVYERLRPIQGTHVPVFLGAIDLWSLNRIYYFNHCVYVVHMIFLLWGGHDLSEIKCVDGRDDGHLKVMVMRSLRVIYY
ncbi:hypothetical protein LZ32DRAFT_633654 [Colletotrichum eremochloae]|nr:hypothetical protein LZ32DRAFT_633654 [Colletotrichum eremochloae]